MTIPIEQAIAAAQRTAACVVGLPRLLIAGATGALGNAVVRRLVGMHRARHTQVLATMPMRQGIRHVDTRVVPVAAPGGDDFSTWPLLPSDVAVVMFDPPRMFYSREKALQTLAGWMLGVTRYMVPSSEQPVRAARVAELVDLALHELPRGSHVLGAALVWQAARRDALQMRRLLRQHSSHRHVTPVAVAGTTMPEAHSVQQRPTP